MREILLVEKTCPFCGASIRLLAESVPSWYVHEAPTPEARDTRVPVVESKCSTPKCQGGLIAMGVPPW